MWNGEFGIRNFLLDPVNYSAANSDRSNICFAFCSRFNVSILIDSNKTLEWENISNTWVDKVQKSSYHVDNVSNIVPFNWIFLITIAHILRIRKLETFIRIFNATITQLFSVFRTRKIALSFIVSVTPFTKMRQFWQIAIKLEWQNISNII